MKSETHQPNFVQDEASSYGSFTPSDLVGIVADKVYDWIDCYSKVGMSK